MHDETLSSDTRVGSSTGSQVAAHAPMSSGDNVALVKSGPEPDIWEIHRPMIKSLYVDQNKTLKEVMNVMQRDYGHKATVKMYKCRITKWGLDKNCKANEMKAIARKKIERDAMGKASSFQIRGRQVEVEEVLRHFKRKGYQSLEDVVARDKSPEAYTPSDVRCSTPGTLFPAQSTNSAHFGSLAPMIEAGRELSLNHFPAQQTPRSHRGKTGNPVPSSNVVSKELSWKNDDLHRLPSLNRLSPFLTPPRDLLVPEQIFSAIKTLFQGTFDGKFWTIDGEGYMIPQKAAIIGRHAIWDWQDCCEAATFFLQQKLFVEARQMLSKACEKSKDVLEEGHARTIPIMFDIYFRLAHAGYGDAAIKVFEHMRSTAMLTPSSTRAFRQLIENMLLLDQSVEEVYFTVWHCSEDIFEQHLEPFNRTWLASRLDSIGQMGSRRGLREAERLLRSLSTSCERKCGDADPRCWEVLISLAWNLCSQEKCQEAEGVGQDIVQRAKNSEDDNIFTRWTIRALNVVSTAQYGQLKYNLARESIEQCIDMAAQVYGNKDPRTIRYSLRLEQWLLGWGRHGEAMSLAAQQSQLLGPPDIEELKD